MRYLIRQNARGKRQYTHRIIMELNVGRKLTTSELVHHKNGNIKDNRIENLEIISRAEHAKLHHAGKRQPAVWKRLIARLARERFLNMTNEEKLMRSEKIKAGIKRRFPNGRIPWNKRTENLR
jgi:hypothetical protein